MAEQAVRPMAAPVATVAGLPPHPCGPFRLSRPAHPSAPAALLVPAAPPVPAAGSTAAPRWLAALLRPSRRLLLIGAAAAGIWLLSGLSHSAEAASAQPATLPTGTVQLASLPAGQPLGGVTAGLPHQVLATRHSPVPVARASAPARRLSGTARSALRTATRLPISVRATRPLPLPAELPTAGSLPVPIALPLPSQLPVPIALPNPGQLPVPIALPNPGQLPLPIALPLPSQLPVPIVLPIPGQLPIPSRQPGLPLGSQRVPAIMPRPVPAGPVWLPGQARPAGWSSISTATRAAVVRPAPSAPAPHRPHPAPGSPNGLIGADVSGRTEAPRPLPVVVPPGRASVGNPTGLPERRSADPVTARRRGCRPDVSPD